MAGSWRHAKKESSKVHEYPSLIVEENEKRWPDPNSIHTHITIIVTRIVWPVATHIIPVRGVGIYPWIYPLTRICKICE